MALHLLFSIGAAQTNKKSVNQKHVYIITKIFTVYDLSVVLSSTLDLLFKLKPVYCLLRKRNMATKMRLKCMVLEINFQRRIGGINFTC